MSDFAHKIILESGYHRYIDAVTQDMIATLLGKNQHNHFDDEVVEIMPAYSRDLPDDVDDQMLNDLVKYRKKYIHLDIDKEKFGLLQEAVKCPLMRQQYIIVDLGYGKAKLTTESLYKAVRDEILNRRLKLKSLGNGFFVRLKREKLFDDVML